MNQQQELAQHGQRDPGRGAVVDLSEHIPTGALYAIKWSEANGHMLAIHGPLAREEVPHLDTDHLNWAADHDLDWARAQQWRQLEILEEEGF